MFVEFGSEQFLCHFVNFFIYSFINTRDTGEVQAMCGTWNKMKLAAISAKLVCSFLDHFLCPVKAVNFAIINTAHKCDVLAVLFDQFRKIIYRHTSLPYIYPHLDHSWNQSCTVAVIVMNDQFHAMVMVVTIDTLVSIKEKLTEHIHTDKCGVLCTPVIMMENNIRYVIMQESLPLPH